MRYDKTVPHASTPRMGNGLTKWIGHALLKIMGWKIKGRLPDEKKVIIIGAPHTSNWDLIVAMSCVLAVGLKFSWMMKKQAFFWPFGGLWKALGGVPIDRSKANNVTQQMAQWFDENETAWLGITPEGTRSKVTKFKKGYLRMAYAAKVPIFVVGINAPTKEIVLDQLWPLTYDSETDNRKIKAYYDKTYKGIKPELG